MIVQHRTKVIHTLSGQIASRELLSFLRQTFEIPEGAGVHFFTGAAGDVDEATPLQFVLTWGADLPEKQQSVDAVTFTRSMPGDLPDSIAQAE